MQIPSFFLDGPSDDLGYINTRDNPLAAERKEYVESLWRQFVPFADVHFRDDARNHFHQRFWEMYLATTLFAKGFELTKHGNDGPEYSSTIDGRRIWFEAIAPLAGSGPDQVPQPIYGEAQSVPVEKILLRYTNALSEKGSRYLAAIHKGIVLPQEPYVLAINSRGIPHAMFGNTMPYYVQAFLPIGPLSVAIDRKSLEVTESSYQYRGKIAKRSGAEVSTRSFLDLEAGFCSAVLHSSVDAANWPIVPGADFSVLHNPHASNPIGLEIFAWAVQFSVSNDTLHRSEPAPH
jgi:hypothetical protein